MAEIARALSWPLSPPHYAHARARARSLSLSHTHTHHTGALARGRDRADRRHRFRATQYAALVLFATIARRLGGRRAGGVGGVRVEITSEREEVGAGGCALMELLGVARRFGCHELVDVCLLRFRSCTHARAYTHTFTHIRARTHTHTHTHTYTHTHTHTCTHTYTHTHVHTHIRITHEPSPPTKILLLLHSAYPRPPQYIATPHPATHTPQHNCCNIMSSHRSQ